MKVKSLAKMYAANFLTSGDAEWVAEELYLIMETSIGQDDFDEQEATKQFLVLIIECMNKHDKDFTEEITKAYLEKTLQTYKKGTTKK
jgi:hypothetical protein